jgi:hypothetical protein
MKLDDVQIEGLIDWTNDPFIRGPHETAHIAKCLPDTIRSLATEVQATRALLASFDEDWLEEIITDSIDLDWTPRTAAKAIVRAMKGGDT